MFDKVLIATDLSVASDCLIGCIGELTALGLRRAVLAHVLYVANSPGLEDRLRDKAAPELQRQKESLEAQGIEVTTEMVRGLPARELDALARRHEVDAVVIGSRGRSLWRSLFGGVSFKLLQIAERPVFLAPVRVVGGGESCRASVCLKSFENLLVPVDFSETSDRIAVWLKELFASFKGSVTLLHVVDIPFAEIHLSGRELEAYRKRAAGQLEELRQRLGEGAAVETELVDGTPWKEIVERSRGERFSLILMGSHGKGFLQEAVFGSVANEVARQSELPVLFVP